MRFLKKSIAVVLTVVIFGGLFPLDLFASSIEIQSSQPEQVTFFYLPSDGEIIELVDFKIPMNVGDTGKISATVESVEDETLLVKASDDGIVSVSEGSVLSALCAGTTSLVAVIKDAEYPITVEVESQENADDEKTKSEPVEFPVQEPEEMLA